MPAEAIAPPPTQSSPAAKPASVPAVQPQQSAQPKAAYPQQAAKPTDNPFADAMTTLRKKFSQPSSLAEEKGRTPEKQIARDANEKPPLEVESKSDGGESLADVGKGYDLMDDGEAAKGESGEESAKPTETKPDKSADKPDNKKPSPWKLVEQYKGNLAKIQKELADLRANPGNHPEFKSITEKLSAIEKRNAELEEEMRYVNYQKHPEFIEKYQKPYEQAWSKAITGLKGLAIQIENPETGEVTARDISPQDIAAFAGMDAASARNQIKQLFKDPVDAAEVRGYVDKIRELAQEQQSALEQQRKVAGEREKTRHEEMSKVQREIHDEITNNWKQSIELASQKYDFLRPIDGDEEHNAALERATKMVEEALNASPKDPKLSKEQRAEIVKRHAGVRNRAIAFSTLKLQNSKLQKQISDMKAQLKQYQGSEPGPGKGSKATTSVQTGDPMAVSLSNLRSGKYLGK